MDELFSIIMPIFNGEDFLLTSIQSIINQTYSHFELLLIDDGSSDNSSTICKNFAEKDKRIKYIYKLNGGISSTRNLGILLSKGKYISFIDQDDIWHSDLLNIINTALITNKVDTVKFSINYIKINKFFKRKIRKFKYNKNRLISKKEIIQKFMKLKRKGFFTFVWNTIYSRDLVVNNQILFDENLKYGGEDNVFNYKYVEYSNNIQIIKKDLYTHYRRKNISQSTKNNSNKIHSNKLFFIAESNFIDMNHIKDSPFRIATFIQGFINNVYQISANRINFEELCNHFYSEVEIIVNRYNELFTLNNLQFSIYKKIITYLINIKKFNVLYLIIKIKNVLRR